MAERKEYEAKVIATLKGLEEGIPIKLDLDEDAWEFGAPPPKNVYRMKLFLAKDGMKQTQQSEDVKDVYYSVNLECRIQSDNLDYDDMPVFTRVDTRVYRGKDISTMAGLLVVAGYRKNIEEEAKSGTLTPLKLTKYMEAALKKEPILLGEVDWRGSYSFLNNKGEETWANPLRKYEDFPMLADGSGRNHITMITDKATGMAHEVRAQSFVSRFFAKDATLPQYNAAGIVKELKLGATAVAPQLVKPIVNNVPSPVAAPIAAPIRIPAAAVTQAPQAPEEDDTNLMLE